FTGDICKQLPKLDDIPDFNERRSPRGQPWNNVGKNKWKHNKPTLILKGGADPVTDKREAEEYFMYQLMGQRALIEFPGVGHAMALPDVRVSDPEFSKHHAMLIANVKVNGTAEVRFLSTRDKLIDTFLADWGDIAEFENWEVVTSIKRAFDCCMRHQDEIEMLVPQKAPRTVSVQVEPKKNKPGVQTKSGALRSQSSRTK
ncbi:MAG: alpha/beta fold hydrolase, partial [Candidatus Binatia bacterium]